MKRMNDEWINGWTNKQMETQTENDWMDGQTNKLMDRLKKKLI